jgi:hypothetical protein
MYIGEDENTAQYTRNASKLALALILIILGCNVAMGLYVGLLLGAFDPYDLHPTYDELERHGYYAYVVPPSMVAQYGWHEETYIRRWRKHCSISQDNRFNPLTIGYFDKQDNLIFRIELTRWGSSMDWKDPKERIAVPLDTQWAKAGTLEMIVHTHENRQIIYMTYADWYGTPVYITSHLSLVDTLTLLHTLNYVGAPPEHAKPWSC